MNKDSLKNAAKINPQNVVRLAKWLDIPYAEQYNKEYLAELVWREISNQMWLG